jgi:hypothetical protein
MGLTDCLKGENSREMERLGIWNSSSLKRPNERKHPGGYAVRMFISHPRSVMLRLARFLQMKRTGVSFMMHWSSHVCHGRFRCS